MRPRSLTGRLVSVGFLIVGVVVVVHLLRGHAVFGDRTGAATATVTTSAGGGAKAGDSAARDFAWGPVKGATAYDVQMVRDGQVVLSRRTTAPHVTVPARWERNGQTVALTAGTYQWFVWPVRRSGSGMRRGPAVVATTFRVGRP